MKRFFGIIEENRAKILDDEFQHLKTVLRSKIGDEIIVLNGTENEYLCKIKEMKKDSAVCDIISVAKCSGLPKKNIVLFQAYTKREKLELIIQKTVELGVKKLVPFSSEFCVAKDAIGKKDRLEKIVLGACKQCECSVPMQIDESIKFDEVLKQIKDFDLVLFANERCDDEFKFLELRDKKDIAIIVGPEGGFSEGEKEKIIKSGAKSISLGKRILRSETAAIVLVGIVSVLSEN